MKRLPEGSIPRRDGLKMLCNRNGWKVFHSSSQKKIRLIPLLSESGSRQPLSIQSMFRGCVNADYHYRQEKSPFLGIEYVREGSLLARQGTRCYRVEPGDVFLLQPGADTEIRTGPEGMCVKDSCPLQGPLLMPFLRTTGLEKSDCITSVDWQRLERLLDDLENLALNKDWKSQIANSLIAYEILELLACPDRSVKPDARIAGLIAFMRSHLEMPLSMDLLVKQSGLPEIALNRAFRSSFGKTPHQMLIEWRMELAEKLIFSRPDLSLKEIAQMAGYPNPMNFSTAFRRFFGSAPREYRRRRWMLEGQKYGGPGGE